MTDYVDYDNLYMSDKPITKEKNTNQKYIKLDDEFGLCFEKVDNLSNNYSKMYPTTNFNKSNFKMSKMSNMSLKKNNNNNSNIFKGDDNFYKITVEPISTIDVDYFLLKKVNDNNYIYQRRNRTDYGIIKVPKNISNNSVIYIIKFFYSSKSNANIKKLLNNETKYNDIVSQIQSQDFYNMEYKSEYERGDYKYLIFKKKSS